MDLDLLAEALAVLLMIVGFVVVLGLIATAVMKLFGKDWEDFGK